MKPLKGNTARHNWPDPPIAVTNTVNGFVPVVVARTAGVDSSMEHK